MCLIFEEKVPRKRASNVFLRLKKSVETTTKVTQLQTNENMIAGSEQKTNESHLKGSTSTRLLLPY